MSLEFRNETERGTNFKFEEREKKSEIGFHNLI